MNRESGAVMNSKRIFSGRKSIGSKILLLASLISLCFILIVTKLTYYTHERIELATESDCGISSQWKWKLKTLSAIYTKLSEIHGRKIIDYLKIDIESAEWKVIPEIIRSGMLSKVRQLAIEVHTSPNQTMATFRQQIRVLRSLETIGNMVCFDSLYNPWTVYNITHLNHLEGSTAYEIAWYNSHLVNKYNSTERKSFGFLGQ